MMPLSFFFSEYDVSLSLLLLLGEAHTGMSGCNVLDFYSYYFLLFFVIIVINNIVVIGSHTVRRNCYINKRKCSSNCSFED